MSRNEEYDPVQAKFCASLLWFVCRISEDGTADIPPEITSPVEITATNVLIVRPAVADYLASGQIYLIVGKSIFKQNVNTLWDLIQIMSNRGIYVMDENEEAVTDLDLMEKFPFKLFSHLALMDSIMLMYVSNMATIQNVVNVVRKFSSFNASKELPFDLEDALILWVNKINQANTVDYVKHNRAIGSEKIRLRKDQLVEKKVFPMVNELVDCFKDCIALLSIVLYYYPTALSVDSVKLSTFLTDDDRASNIEMFRSVCAEHICTSVFALRIEDFLFGSEHLKSNFLALLCEIFYKLEIGVSHNTVFTNPAASSGSERMHVEPPASSGSGRSSEHTVSDPQRSKSSQPLLSKRSKKQFAIFETELIDDAPKTLPIHYKDMDARHPTTSTQNKHQIPQAWSVASQIYDDPRMKKQSKISLNFRPDESSSTHLSIRSNVSDTGHIHSTEHEPNAAMHGPSSSWTINANYSVQPAMNDLSYSDGVKLVENAMMSSYDTNPTKRPSNVKKDKIAHDLKDSDTNENFNHRRNPNLRNITDNYYGMASYDIPQTSVVESHGQMTDLEEDDALSTITEATEPEAPSMYSFHSSSSSTSTKLNTSSDERLNLSHDKDGGGYFMDDLQTSLYGNNISMNRERSYNNSFSRSISSESSEANRTLTNDENVTNSVNHENMPSSVEVPSHHVRGSYTVNQGGTLESALATGLPIITESMKRSYHVNQVNSNTALHYFDVTSSQEITAKESENVVFRESPLVGHSNNENRMDVNEFEDVAIHLQNPSGNSNSSGSRSSSSGISADDGRYHMSSANDENRPGHIIYSSLSERTDGSPVLFNAEQNIHSPTFQHESVLLTPKDIHGTVKVQNESSEEERKQTNRPNELKLPFKQSILKDSSNVTPPIEKPSYHHWPFKKLDFSQKKDTIAFDCKEAVSPGKITWFDLVADKPIGNSVDLQARFKQLQKKKQKSSLMMRWTDVLDKSFNKPTLENEEQKEGIISQWAKTCSKSAVKAASLLRTLNEILLTGRSPGNEISKFLGIRHISLLVPL